MNQIAQVISEPQHIGDLIIPQPLGHLVTETFVPSSLVISPGTMSQLHLAHFIPTTPIPHNPQEY